MKGKYVAFAVATLLASSTALGRGGELGNARFVDYRNLATGLQASYPENWEVLDMETTVNFQERDVPAGARGTQAVIQIQYKPALRNSEELLRELQSTGQQQAWKATSVEGKPAFVLRSPAVTDYRVLRAPGEVVRIRAEKGDWEPANSLLDKVVASVGFVD
jgi:hypothetical protein